MTFFYRRYQDGVGRRNHDYVVEAGDGDKPVLWDVDLSVPAGTLMAIVGPNGAGKSTLIKAILGLIKPVAGTVLIKGKSYDVQRQIVGYVPQRGSVDWDFPTNVLDVVMMGRYRALGWIRRPGKAEKEMAMGALEKVGMSDYAERQISQLSGGQQQRVFLARALAQDAQIYFMDEPFAGVDPISVNDIKHIINHLRDRGIGVLITDHNVRETLGICGRAYILSDGSLIASGSPEEILENHHVREVYLGQEFKL